MEYISAFWSQQIRLNHHNVTLYVTLPIFFVCVFFLTHRTNWQFSLFISSTHSYFIYSLFLLFISFFLRLYFFYTSFYSFSLSNLSLIFRSLEMCLVFTHSLCTPRITTNRCIYPDHQCTMLWYFPFRRTQIWRRTNQSKTRRCLPAHHRTIWNSNFSYTTSHPHLPVYQ
jgi:hypothetical protein